MQIQESRSLWLWVSNPCQETDDRGRDVVPSYRRLSRDGNSQFISVPRSDRDRLHLQHAAGPIVEARPFSKALGPMGEAVRRAISPAMGWG